MPFDVWTQMIENDHSLCKKNLRARNKVAHVELLRGLARPVPRFAVTVTYRNQERKKQERFSELRKKGVKLKTKKNNDDFLKVVICDLRASKYKRHRNKPNDGCLWKPAKRNSVCAEQTTPICCDHWNIYCQPGTRLALRFYLCFSPLSTLVWQSL